MAAKLIAHSAADVLPMMGDDEYAAFKADIAAHGLREPIVLHEGRIVDGRNRYRACRELNLEPTTTSWDAKGSLVSFIASMNIHRRHLTSSQRAIVAAEYEPMLAAEAAERKKVAGRKGGESSGATRRGETKDVQSIEQPSMNGRAVQQAAKITGTNRQYVADAKKLKAEAPELLEEVRIGARTLPEARREHVRQQSLKDLPAGPTPHQEARESPARRWCASLHKLYVLLNSTRDLGGIAKLAKKWTADARNEYIAELRRIVGELTKWIHILEEGK